MRAEWQEQLVFTNDFKVRFCNGYDALKKHAHTCPECAVYLTHGDGDLCGVAKRLIAWAMLLEYREP